jgi:hypothetical protein
MKKKKKKKKAGGRDREPCVREPCVRTGAADTASIATPTSTKHEVTWRARSLYQRGRVWSTDVVKNITEKTYGTLHGATGMRLRSGGSHEKHAQRMKGIGQSTFQGSSCERPNGRSRCLLEQNGVVFEVERPDCSVPAQQQQQQQQQHDADDAPRRIKQRKWAVSRTKVCTQRKSHAAATAARRQCEGDKCNGSQTHAVTLLMMAYARARASSRTSSWDTSVATLKSSRASNVQMSSPAAMLPSGASQE